MASTIFSSVAALLSLSAVSRYFGLSPSTDSCRCFPEDPCWPELEEWQSFNKTLGGKLIATVPIASVCHTNTSVPYDEAKCEALKAEWFFPSAHVDSPSSVQAPFFAKHSCNPFLPAGDNCNDLGGFVKYSVKAETAADFQETIKFTQKHNIRLVIRNTAHDLNGKSTGAGAVAIWTHHMTDMKVHDYSSDTYKGKAITLGAGVMVQDLNKFAEKHGVIAVGGNCGTVGVVGGYAQGGGHGPLASKFGLAVDSILEWQVVLASGELVTASATENPDLFWALRGGGGGTYGVVASMTTKVFPNIKTSGFNLTFARTEENIDRFYDVVSTFQESLPAMVDAGVVATWVVLPQAFALVPATAPGLSKEELDALMQPTLDKLKEHEIPYMSHSEEFSSYLRYYQAMTPPWATVAKVQIGGRLIPREVVEQQNAELMKITRDVVDDGAMYVGLAFNVSKSVPSPDYVSANPNWRKCIISTVIGIDYDYNDYEANLKVQRKITDDIVPRLAALTPGGASYMNEGDFNQPDWKTAFYGPFYDRLDKVKKKYDPEDYFYALTAVGSDRWAQKEDGRLCRA
jgi:hypothetical protein